MLRTGGIIPITRQAEKEVDWSEHEMHQLISMIKADHNDTGDARDSTCFLLKHNAGTFPINWEKIPAKYKNDFEELKDNLKIVKG